MVEHLVAEAEQMVVFQSGSTGQFVVTAPGPNLSMQLYTQQMIPVTLTTTDGMLTANVEEGEGYVLIVDSHGTNSPRNLRFEMMALGTDLAASEFDFTNHANRFDVNHDGLATPGDALRIINDLNRNGPRQTNGRNLARLYFDTNDDKFVTSHDVLAVINYLNRTSAEGESGSPPFADVNDVALDWSAAEAYLPPSSQSTPPGPQPIASTSLSDVAESIRLPALEHGSADLLAGQLDDASLERLARELANVEPQDLTSAVDDLFAEDPADEFDWLAGH